jgi:magnesium transporter
MEAHKIKKPQAVQALTYNKITWADIQNPDSEIFADLEARYRLHPVHLKESIQQVQHSQVEREQQYLFFVLHIPQYSPKEDKMLVDQVGIFLGNDFLITIRTGKAHTISSLHKECVDDLESRHTYFKHSSAYLLYLLISHILSDIFVMTENVISELDSIEDLVFANNGSDAQRIGKIRQKIVKLARVIGPKKLILEDLTQQIDSFTGQSMSKYFSNNTKTVSKLWEVIEEAKETIEIYKDADFTTSTERTNRILAVLTLIFTFTIPVTVIGTLYGMNVFLPGSINGGSWLFLGKYTTFGIVIAISTISAIVMYIYFRKKKWF